MPRQTGSAVIATRKETMTYAVGCALTPHIHDFHSLL